MKFLTLKTLAVALFLSPALAYALQDYEISGRVLNVDEQDRTMTLRIQEVGDDLGFDKGSVRTFDVPDDVNVDGYLSTNFFATFDDLDDRDIVRVEFDPDELDDGGFVGIWTKMKKEGK